MGCGTVLLGELDNGCALSPRFEEVEGGGKDLVLALDIVCCAEWSTHGVIDDQCSWHAELICPVFERANHDGDCRHSRVLDRCRNVPDRHVAHRSDGDEEHHIDPLLVNPLDPSGQLLAEPALCRCSWEGVEGLS